MPVDRYYMHSSSTERTGPRPIAATVPGGGAYLLILNVLKNLKLCIGALGKHTLQGGVYLYVGSAKSGIGGRVRRHVRLSKLKVGGGKWHIDNLLRHSSVEIAGALSFPDAEECTISGVLASHGAIEAPVAGFGSSDCRSGCRAHLYRLSRTIAGDGTAIIEYIREIF